MTETNGTTATPATETKKWWQSLGVTGGVGTLLASILGLVVSLWPEVVTREDAQTLTANVPAAITAGAAVIGSIVAIVGRVRARKTIAK